MLLSMGCLLMQIITEESAPYMTLPYMSLRRVMEGRVGQRVILLAVCNYTIQSENTTM